MRCARPRPSLPCPNPLAAWSASRSRRRSATPLQASLALGLLLALCVAASASAQGTCPAVELKYDDSEQISEKRTDTNKDCKADQTVFYEDGKPARAEQDTNFDGRVDLWIVYGPDGKPAR